MASASQPFRAVELPEIPPLAWLLSFDEDGPALYHGSGVDIFAQGFFEGGFAGEFGSDPRHTANVFGSGMWRADGAWYVITPSHILEAVFVVKRDGVRGVSNSLPFLVEHFSIDVPVDLGWARTMLTVSFGIDRYQRQLFSSAGNQVSRYYFRNLCLTDRGQVLEIDKPRDDDFESYADYVCYMKGVLRASFANATDARRQARYEPIGAMSSGYDSNASTALAVSVGCREGITIRQSRQGEDGDSGKPVADALGIAIHEFDRPDPHTVSFDQLAEFFVPGTSGSDYIYHVFEERLQHRILLSGTYGDKVWRPDAHPGEELTRASTDGTSFHEFRLRSNFLHIPVPMIGGRRHALLRDIALRDEMKPWSVSGDYDAPISRRILEEMAVSRTAFGQVKRAAGLPLSLGKRYGPPRATRQRVSEEVERETDRRANRLGIARRSFDYRRRLITWYLRYGLVLGAERFALRVVPSWGTLGDRLYLWRILAKQEHPETSVMALVSLAEVRKRYAVRMDEPSGKVGW